MTTTTTSRGLRELVAREGLQDRVSWLGEREDVPELIGALDVLLLPSWEEPFGRALIEAMALGVPVVATSVGGPPEIVEQGRQGYLLAPRAPSDVGGGDRAAGAQPGARPRRWAAPAASACASCSRSPTTCGDT